MKFFRNMVKPIMLSVFTALTLISCDIILEHNEDNDEISGKAKARINIHKQEAKLLLKASENNLDILELCEVIKYVDTQNIVTHLTRKLEKTHFEISKNYEYVAKDKLISIPSYIRIKNNNKFKELNIVHSELFIEKKLKLILNKTQAQIQLLDTLGNITDNVEFKVLAIKDTHKLKSNINKIEITLNTLNQQTKDIIGTKKLIL